jgi:hypothetical protein
MPAAWSNASRRYRSVDTPSSTVPSGGVNGPELRCLGVETAVGAGAGVDVGTGRAVAG